MDITCCYRTLLTLWDIIFEKPSNPANPCTWRAERVVMSNQWLVMNSKWVVMSNQWVVMSSKWVVMSNL